MVLLPPLPPPDPGFEMVVSRPGMSQGLAQTDGIQLFPRAFVQVDGARIGVQWRNIDSVTANGVAAVFVSAARELKGVRIDAAVRYRIKTGVKGPARSEAWEFAFGARRSFGRLGVRFYAEYSPDEFGRGPSLWAEAGPTLAIGRQIQLSANIGRRERARDPDYTAFNAGVSRALGRRLSVDLRYFGTDRGHLGERYSGRITLSARLAL